MQFEKKDVIVIGGGPGGVTAALRARELGATVALVEQDRMGGTCTNDGCVPTRVLAKAARLVRDAEQFAEYGLLGQRPEVDLVALLARTQETVYRVHEKKQLLGNLAQAGVEVRHSAGPAQFLDKFTIALGDDQQLAADKFILCAGGHARRLDFPGSEYALTHSGVWQLEKLPASVAIIGGAATGCQLASILAAFGCRVTILDVAPTLLGAEDEAVSRCVTDSFIERGIQVITGITGVEQIEPNQADGLWLHYGLAGQTEIIEAEAIIMAVGWVGNIETLNLEAADVETNRGYVEVDDSLRTSASHIFAAGDITGQMMLVQSATQEGRIAAENAVLGSHRAFRHEVVPHGGFTDPEYASVGLTESQAAAGRYAVATVPYADLDRAVIDGRVEGFCKLIVTPDGNRILGAHVVGEQAVEVVQIAAAGMAANSSVHQLGELELAYPTFTAIIGLAARQLVRDLGLTPLAPVWRALKTVESRPAEWEIQGT